MSLLFDEVVWIQRFWDHTELRYKVLSGLRDDWQHAPERSGFSWEARPHSHAASCKGWVSCSFFKTSFSVSFTRL